MPASPPHIRIPSPSPSPGPVPGSSVRATSATPARSAAFDDLLAPTPTPASAFAPWPTSPRSIPTHSPSFDASRSAALSPGLDLGRMLASPSFAPEMRISASQGSAHSAAAAAPARPAPSTHSPADARSRSPSSFRRAALPRASPPPALTSSSSRPDSPPHIDAHSTRLPGLGSLLNAGPMKRQHSAPYFVPYVPHVAAKPATTQESGRGPPPDLDGLGMVLGTHQRHSQSSSSRPSQPAAPKIGTLKTGRFESVMDLHSPDDQQAEQPVQPQPYPSSLISLNQAPTSAVAAKPCLEGNLATYPRDTALTGLGISFHEPPQGTAPTQDDGVARTESGNAPCSAGRSPSLPTPATTVEGRSLSSMGMGLPMPSGSGPLQPNGLSPVLDRVPLSGGSPHGSVESVTPPTPSEEITPLYSLASLPDESNLSRSFEAVQATLPGQGGGTAPSSRARGPASYRELCRARSAALVQSTASAFEAHRSPAARTRGPASDAPIPPGAEDSPWGVFSLKPKKLGGWRPLFPPGINPPVPGGIRSSKADEPSPPKRARTARAAPKKAPQSKGKAVAGRASKGGKSLAKPSLSMKSANQMMT